MKLFEFGRLRDSFMSFKSFSVNEIQYCKKLDVRITTRVIFIYKECLAGIIIIYSHIYRNLSYNY